MSTFGEYSPEVEVQADYENTKHEILAASQGPLGWIAVAAIWIIRSNTLRHLRRKR